MKVDGCHNILYWANAYKVSMALFALTRSGALQALSERAHHARELADRLGLHEEALAPILLLLSKTGILVSCEAGYRLVPKGAALLPFLELEDRMCAHRVTPGALAAALKGEPGGDPMTASESGLFRPIYLATMANGARALAPCIVRFARFPKGSHLLDLGGADGALASYLAPLMPDLRVTVVDREAMRPFFEKRKAAANGRIDCRFHSSDLNHPEGLEKVCADVNGVILSNILHLLSHHARKRLLSTLLTSLPQGSTLVFYDTFPGQFEGRETTYFAMVDWVMVGSYFALEAQAFATELAELGFQAIQTSTPDLLEGTLIKADIP